MNNIYDRIATIEEKAIRRVRTPEGARMYGQPIGTVITRDMIERAKRKRAREKAKGKNTSSAESTINSSISFSDTSKRTKSPMRSNDDAHRTHEERLSDVDIKKRQAQARMDNAKSDATRKKYQRIIDNLSEYERFLKDDVRATRNTDLLKEGMTVRVGNDWKTIESVKPNYRKPIHKDVKFTDGTETTFKRSEEYSILVNGNSKTKPNDESQDTSKVTDEPKLPSDGKPDAEPASNFVIDKNKKVSDIKPGDKMLAGATVRTVSKVERDGDRYKLTFEEFGTKPVTLRGEAEFPMMRRKTDEEAKTKDVKAGMLKPGDRIKRNGDWETVKETRNGKTAGTTEIVLDDGFTFEVSSNRGFDTISEEPKKATARKREPGTSRFGKKPDAKPSSEMSDSGTTSKNGDSDKRRAQDESTDNKKKPKSRASTSPKSEGTTTKPKDSSGTSKKPKTAVPAPDKNAPANDVMFEERPITGDEMSARAKKYEKDAEAQIEEYRKARKEYFKLGYPSDKLYTPTAEEFNDLPVFPANKTPKSEDDLTWVDSKYISGAQFARWGNTTLIRTGKPDTKSRYLLAKFGAGVIDRYAPFTDRSGKPKLGTPEVFEHIKSKHGDYLTRDLPKRVKRDEAPFWDYWNGIRGIDWMAGEETDADYKTLDKFTQKNFEESQRLGVKVSEGFDPEHHAVLNSVLETYRERYPGLLDRNINGFGIVDGKNKFTAAFHANGRVRDMGNRNNAPLGNGANRLSFNNAYFGTSKKSREEKWNYMDKYGLLTGFFVGGDRVDLAEKLGVKPEHINAMYTINHEIGHAVGSWIFGETGVDNISGRTQLISDPQRAIEVSKRYSDKVSAILRKYKVLGDDKELKDYVNTAEPRNLNEGMMDRLAQLKVINRTDLAANLSSYGATNLHEVMAETWASFSMDENPTEFALELGEMMEDLLLELSEETNLEERFGKKSLRESIESKLLHIRIAGLIR